MSTPRSSTNMNKPNQTRIVAKEKEDKVDAVTTVQQMKINGHHVMVAPEGRGGYSYKSFASEAELHVWMSTIHDAERHLCRIDLSTWCHKDASPDLQVWVRQNFVATLFVEVEWYSNDDLPDPLAADRIAAVTMHMTRALQCVGQRTVPDFSQRDTGGVSRRTPRFRNCYLVFAADVLFHDNICMKDFIRTVLIPALTDEPLLFQRNTSFTAGVRCSRCRAAAS
jgi:hypothetical protein